MTNTVTPISWARFPAPPPADSTADAARQVLANALRYCLNVWLPEQNYQPISTGSIYSDLGGTDEAHIRPPAMEAFALAAGLRTGGYDPTATGVSVAVAQAKAYSLIRSLAFAHRAHTVGGWGSSWQSALWAGMAGGAGWLLWDVLSATARTLVANMVAAEADRFLTYTVPYYRRLDGTIVTPGDSKAEENAWNASVLELALAMMPTHPNVHLWQVKSYELMVSAYSIPADTTSIRVINGRRLSVWLHGSNIEPEGVVINHNRVHPDYSTTITGNTWSALVRTLAGQPAPEVARFNLERVYRALVDLVWTTGDDYYPPGGLIRAPGGTILVRDASTGEPTAVVYYPQGNDWGTDRHLHLVTVVAHAHVFGRDNTATITGEVWEALHLQRALEMQARGSDGRTYQLPGEDTYLAREPWVAWLAAQTWLTHWLAAQPAGFAWTNTAP